MSIDYILQKVQDPEVSSRDLTSHFLYYFRQLSGQSGFPIEEKYLLTIQQIIKTIIEHPSWNYEHSVAQLTAGFDGFTPKNPFSKAQKEKHALAFGVFLDAIDETQRQRFLFDHLDMLRRVGASSIPCVMAATLTQEIGVVQTINALRRKI